MIQTRLVEKDGITYVECLAGGGLIQAERDALDLAAACWEHQTARLLIHAASLSEDFYQLKTGLAGAVLQKFANYHIRAAAVIPAELAGQGRFGEMVLEANRGNQFRVFQDHAAAERWLTGE